VVNSDLFEGSGGLSASRWDSFCKPARDVDVSCWMRERRVADRTLFLDKMSRSSPPAQAEGLYEAAAEDFEA